MTNNILEFVLNVKFSQSFKKLENIFSSFSIIKCENGSFNLKIKHITSEFKEQNIFFLLNFEINNFYLIFERKIENFEFFSSFLIKINDTNYEIIKPTKKNILTIYSILYEDIITCGCSKSKKEKSITLLKQNELNSKITDLDLTKYLESNQLLRYSDLAGTVIISPSLSKVYRGLIEFIKKEMCFNFEEMFIPKLVSINDWFKSGHFKRFGSELMYVSEFKNRNNEDSIADRYDMLVENKITEKFKDNLKIPEKGLVFAQCESFWNFVKKKVINKKCLPLCIFDVSGNSYRNEGGAVHSITRLNEFRRLELIFLGTKEHIQEVNTQLLKNWTDFLTKLGLNYEIQEVQSWMGVSQNTISTKDFIINFNDSKELEVGNLSNNSKKFVDKWSVKCNNKEQLYSGCAGVGIDRLVWALLKLYGPDITKWPENICTYLNINNNKFEKIFV